MGSMRTTLPVHPIDLEPFRTGGPGRAPGGRAAARRGVPRHRLPGRHRPRCAAGHVRRRARRVRRVLRPTRRREARGGRRRPGGEPRLQRARRGRAVVQPGRGEPARPVRGVQRRQRGHRAASTTSGTVRSTHPTRGPTEPGAPARRVARVRPRRHRGRRHHPRRRWRSRSTSPSSGSSNGASTPSSRRARSTTSAAPTRPIRSRARCAWARTPTTAILTVLLADDVPGLQVFRDGVWHDVSTPRGRVRVQPRRHARPLDQRPLDLDPAPGRARHPPAAPAPVRRRSIARFLDCPPDLVVETIPSCVDDEHPAALRTGQRRRVAAREGVGQPRAPAERHRRHRSIGRHRS